MAKRFRFELAIYIALPAIGTPEIANGDDGPTSGKFPRQFSLCEKFRENPRLSAGFQAIPGGD